MKISHLISWQWKKVGLKEIMCRYLKNHRNINTILCALLQVFEEWIQKMLKIHKIQKVPMITQMGKVAMLSCKKATMMKINNNKIKTQLLTFLMKLENVGQKLKVMNFWTQKQPLLAPKKINALKRSKIALK